MAQLNLIDVDDDMDELIQAFPSRGPQSSNGSEWKGSVAATELYRRDMPLRDISRQAVWTLSSCKTGYGVHELLHDSVDKYWQSDGPQPHTVTIEFPAKTDLCFIMLYLDYKNDESYTPSKIIVHLGSSLMHMDEGQSVTLSEPAGWQTIKLTTPQNRPSRAMAIQLQVVHNHQNGRDTHIRHIRVVGPGRPRFSAESRLLAGRPDPTSKFDYNALRDLNSKLIHSMVIR